MLAVAGVLLRRLSVRAPCMRLRWRVSCVACARLRRLCFWHCRWRLVVWRLACSSCAVGVSVFDEGRRSPARRHRPLPFPLELSRFLRFARRTQRWESWDFWVCQDSGVSGLRHQHDTNLLVQMQNLEQLLFHYFLVRTEQSQCLS